MNRSSVDCSLIDYMIDCVVFGIALKEHSQWKEAVTHVQFLFKFILFKLSLDNE